MPIVVNWTEVLPAELVVKILSYLDFYSISQVRRVSKRCHAIIEIDPFILPSFLQKTRPYVKHLAKYMSHNDEFTGFPLDPAARVANLLEEKMKSVQRDNHRKLASIIDVTNKSLKSCKKCNIDFISRKGFIEHCQVVHHMRFKLKNGQRLPPPLVKN